LIALAAVSWGTTGTATTFLVRDTAISPLAIGVARLALAALVLGILARRAGSLRIARAELVPCIAMGATMAVFQAGYFSAVVLVGVALTALIAICSAPLIIAVLARIFLAERLSPLGMAALALGVTGTAMLIGGTTAITGARTYAAGVLLALAAGASYATYVVIAKTSVARSQPLPVAAWTFAAGTLWLAPVLAAVAPSSSQLATGWPWLLYLGVVTTGLAYAAYTTGLQSTSAAGAGIVALLEPLTATLLGVALFNERFGPTGIVGGLLLLSAVTLLIREETRIRRVAVRTLARNARSHSD
jgi:DME family drug/metabolite transporter